MYLLNLFLMVIAVGGGNLQGHDQTLMKNLQSRHIRTIRVGDAGVAKTVSESFEVLSKYHKQIKIQELLHSPFVTQMFERSLSRSLDQHVGNSLESAQYIMLLHLYQTMFCQYIKTAESFLNDLISAKKYWFYEDFYMSQSPLRRHPAYSVYSSAYKKNVARKVAILEELEGQVAHMLGMCLYGTQKIASIEQEDQIVGLLTEAITPLYKMYHTPLPIEEIQHDPSGLFRDLLWMYGTIDQSMEHVKSELQENNKPSFASEHWFGLSCAAVTALAVYVVYKKNEQEVPRLQEKSVATAKYIWNDYIVIPIHDLVDVLWYNQGKKIHHLPRMPRIEEQDLSWKTWLADSTVNKLVRPFWNNLVAWVESSADIYVDQTNDLVMKNQQVNLALAAIGPVLLTAYLAAKYTKAGYNRFVKHDNWYAPMKYSLRAADQLINSVARNNVHSFADDGKLYILIMNVKQYIACLDNEELILMQIDLDDLLSLGLTYEQKHGVIERMYRTYQFLK